MNEMLAGTKTGTVAGAILSGGSNLVKAAKSGVITNDDIVKTIVLAAIGAAVSFLVTLCLNRLKKALKKKG